VDRIAGKWARASGIDLVEYPTDWTREGRHAALIRNERMLRDGMPDTQPIRIDEPLLSKRLKQLAATLRQSRSSISALSVKAEIDPAASGDA
jgi:hypothetical protein